MIRRWTKPNDGNRNAEIGTVLHACTSITEEDSRWGAGNANRGEPPAPDHPSMLLASSILWSENPAQASVASPDAGPRLTRGPSTGPGTHRYLPFS
jgi:hypothetical protein